MSQTYIPSALRRQVFERARGRCEYCRILEKITFCVHQFDHVIAEKHGGPTEFRNLALSCVVCNKFKGSDIASVDPATGDIVPLYNPRLDDWSMHFELSSDGTILAKTPTGRATARLLRFNDPGRVLERKLLLEAGELLP